MFGCIYIFILFYFIFILFIYLFIYLFILFYFIFILFIYLFILFYFIFILFIYLFIYLFCYRIQKFIFAYRETLLLNWKELLSVMMMMMVMKCEEFNRIMTIPISLSLTDIVSHNRNKERKRKWILLNLEHQ